MIVSSLANSPAGNGLAITTSNVLLGLVPTITNPGIDQTPANISDPDHSNTYTCGTASGFEISYGALTEISYVALSGHNAATPNQATVQLFNGATLIDTAIIKRNHNLVFTFAEMTFQDLIIKFITVPATYEITVSFVAAGKFLTIPTGEQAGYARSWLKRSLVQNTSSNFESAPTAITQKRKALKGSLNLPNQLASFTWNEWQDFIDFSYEQPFFIREIETKPESSYICFDPVHSVKAHGQTRALNVVNLTFSLYNGL